MTGERCSDCSILYIYIYIYIFERQCVIVYAFSILKERDDKITVEHQKLTRKSRVFLEIRLIQLMRSSSTNFGRSFSLSFWSPEVDGERG